MTTDSESSSQVNLDVEHKLLYAGYARKPMNVWMGVAVAPLGAVLLWPFFPAWAMISWLLAIWFTSGLGALDSAAFKRAAPQGAELVFWRRVFTAQVVAGALGWSLGPTLLLWQSTGSASVLLVGTLFAVCTVAMISVAHVKIAMQAFVVAVMLPAAISAFLAPNGAEQVTGAVLLLGMVLIIGVGSISANTIRTEVETQLRLQGILDTAPDAVVTLDGAGRITSWNPRAHSLFGWSQQEVLGNAFDEVVELVQPGDGSVSPLAQLQADRGPGPARRVEMLAHHRSGMAITVEVAITRSSVGNTQSLTVFVVDTTQRKDALEKLALFRKVFEASSQCVVIADATGRGLYQNPAHMKALGYSDEEIAGEQFMRALPKDSAEAMERVIRQALVETGVWSGLLPFRRKDGSEFTSRSGIGSISNGDGKIQYLFNIFTDITEMLAQREELRLAKEDAERANRAKSEFLSSMSHELRTPLNAILGFAQIIDFDETLSAEQRGRVAEISRGGHHLLKLINEVLDLAKIESGTVTLNPEPVVVGDVIDECWRLLNPLATARQLAVHKRVPAGTMVVADRIRLKQVMLNLLSNAIKYNRVKGEIGIRVSLKGPARVRVEVRDTGAGIAAERLKDAFKPFNRVGKGQIEGEGTGIGLSITEQLVVLMGGEVGVHSQLGVGTEFWFELPLHTAGDMEVLTEPESPSARPESDGALSRVLCIDDNPVNLRLITQILAKRPNIEVITAPTPGLGIQIALAQKPDLILLDINMPDMDGYQVLDVLKTYSRTKNIPIVAVTANALPRDVEKGGAAGLDAYLTKPLDVRLFLETVDKYLAMPVT
jgi:PAS domain S-box-containing protein